MSSETSSPAVERLLVEELPAAARKRTNGSTERIAASPSPPQGVVISPAIVPEMPRFSDPSVAVNRMVLASLEAVGFVLFPRLLLLLALVGAFALGVLAMSWQSGIGLEILIAFTALTVAPLAWLERMSRRR